jgi:hypothetical protein
MSKDYEPRIVQSERSKEFLAKNGPQKPITPKAYEIELKKVRSVMDKLGIAR